jgi:hypothetical protein
MKKIPPAVFGFAIFVFVVGVAGIAAMSTVVAYYPDTSGYINFGIWALSLAAVVVYFMRRKVDVGSRG